MGLRNILCREGLLLGVLTVVLTGCVGPATPFGSIDSLSVTAKSDLKIDAVMNALEGLDASIEFSPDRQVLHGYSEFQVKINDPYKVEDEHSLRVTYDGVDISDLFLKGSTPLLDQQRNTVTYKWGRIKLPPHRSNLIRFAYLNGKGQVKAQATYELPDCNLLSLDSIQNTRPFKTPKELIENIEFWGKEYAYSPTLVAGLVAQESAFNPKAVSWAKAVGLTQVTPLADAEVAKRYSEWPRSKKIHRLPASLLKTWIKMGKVSPKEDWRLDPERSIQGGYEYLRYLHTYWHKKRNAKVFSSVYGKSSERLTEVILASYNSGAYRVKTALKSYGPNYLMAGNLSEARKYVGKVSSYCYHFSQPSDKGEL